MARRSRFEPDYSYLWAVPPEPIFHDADLWVRSFQQATAERPPDRRQIRQLRMQVLEQTTATVMLGQYLLPDMTRVSLPADMRSHVAHTKLYRNAPSLDDLPEKSVEGAGSAAASASASDSSGAADVKVPQDLGVDGASDAAVAAGAAASCRVLVVEGDCLDVALLLKKRGLRPLLLNMASARYPGGGYKKGAGAQEENLHRRSNYFEHLENPENLPRKSIAKLYPIPEFGAVYSPQVVFFRGNESQGYPFLPEPQTLDCIAVAAYREPDLVSLTEMDPEIARRTKYKIRTLLSVAAVHRHDCLVLSALGCGAYQNPPQHVARLFHEVLDEPHFQRRFALVVFAIIEDHNSVRQDNVDGNCAPFSREFGCPSLPSDQLEAALDAQLPS